MPQPDMKKLSLAQTPVRRALARAKRPLLYILLVAGFVAGLVYQHYTKEQAPVSDSPAVVSKPS